jgi:endogenous inhibitor of DNA gyrase (YacG/DUF329 family)
MADEAAPGKVGSGFPSGTATSHKCPQCGKPAAPRFAPFCSLRCQRIDLGRWLKGDYVIPGRPDEDAGRPDVPAPADDPDAE